VPGPVGPQGEQGIPGQVQNSDIWLPGTEGLSPLITAHDPATGRLDVGGVPLGDTGWRSVQALCINGWVFSQGPYLRRIGGTVYVQLHYNAVTTPGTAVYFMATVSGFTAGQNRAYQPLPGSWAAGSATGAFLANGVQIGVNGWTSGAPRGIATWSTTDAWPTELPGTQVTPPAGQVSILPVEEPPVEEPPG
jgi:hypothetical protein